jgi:deoxycytidylate deaminase
MLSKKLEFKIKGLSERFFEEGAVGDLSYRHFSFITDGNRIICYGWNDAKKTHPQAIIHGFEYGFIHSELAAFLRFPHRPSLLNKFTLVNTRVGRKGTLIYSRPCKNCQKLIAGFNFKSCYYSNEYGIFEEFKWRSMII